MGDVAVVFVGWVALAGLTAWLAAEKGRSGIGWFGASLLLGPLALVAVGLAPKGEPAVARGPLVEKLAPGWDPHGARKCPYCGVVRPARDRRCSNCGSELVILEHATVATTKTCPRCAEDVKAAALICRFCGYEFGEQKVVG